MWDSWWKSHEAEFVVWGLLIGFCVLLALLWLPFAIVAKRRQKRELAERAEKIQKIGKVRHLGLSRDGKEFTVGYDAELSIVSDPLVETITYGSTYGGFVKKRISHHEGCTVRGRGRHCGCDPIVTEDRHFPRSKPA